MKTIEEKARAYDEALERAKQVRKYSSDLAEIKRMEHIFPELAESEEERIRKELIEYFRWNVKQILNDFSNKECIAWLEKQGEQKSAECIKFNNEFENQVSHLIASILNGEHEYNEGFVKYVAQSLLSYAKNELKPIEWSEEDEDDLNNIIWLCDNCIRKCEHTWIPSQATRIKSLIERIKDIVFLQPKQQWSEEDENMIRYIGNAITCEESSKYLEEKGVDMIKAHSWLESLKPQFKQEWSEEDEKRVHRISDFIWKNRKGGIDEVYQQEQDANWIKSLKDKYTWKPSEKQINALSDVLSLKDIKYDVLSELLECLKKLK